MLIIKVEENETIDRALKRFKKKFERTGILRRIRERKFYEKPCITRKKERARSSYKQKILLENN